MFDKLYRVPYYSLNFLVTNDRQHGDKSLTTKT